MRHYGMLSDPALNVLADIIEVLERTGELPPQLSALAMPMLAKPRGGHRAVSTFVSLYRLWNRLRRDDVRKWEETVDRKYWASGSGRSPQDAVWRQAARAEAAVAESQQSATLLWDMAAFFESIRRVPLWHRAMRLAFPTTIAAVAMNTYDSVRMLSMAGAVARPMLAADGVPAGCGYAMALTKAYCVHAFDRVAAAMMEMRPPPSLGVYVDDVSVSAEGSLSKVVEVMGDASELLKEEIEEALSCRIEVDKAAVVASSWRLTQVLRAKFGRMAGPAGDGKASHGAALNLGIDYAAGKRRSAHGPGAKRRARLKKLRNQTGRIARLRQIAGRRTPAIFVAGPLPAAVYGAAVNGLSDVEVMKVRRAAAHAYTPRAKGRSLRRLFLMMGVPTWKAEVEPFLQYHKEVWRATLLGHREPVDGQMTLTQIAKLWRAVGTERIFRDEGRRRDWNASRGPISAMHLALHRVSWRMSGPYGVVNDFGDEITLTKTAPKLMEQLLRAAVRRELQRDVGRTMAEDNPEFAGRRAAAEHIDAQLRTDRGLGARGRAAYLSVACNAIMTYDRAQKMGYEVVNLCPKCRRAPDTVFHRIWKCQCEDVVAARRAVAPPWICREAERADGAEAATFWISGIFPHPGDTWPRPSNGDDAHCEWSGPTPPAPGDRRADGAPHVSGKV